MSYSGASQNGAEGGTREHLIGIAVVGLGYWGPNWVRNLQNSGMCDRIAACDSDAARRRHLEKFYPTVRTHERIEPVLEDPAIKAVVRPYSACIYWRQKGRLADLRRQISSLRLIFVCKSTGARARPSAWVTGVTPPGF